MRVVVLWSGGKDSAFALHELMRTGEYEVAALLTTVTEEYERISMHGVRRELLRSQAAAVGCAVEEVPVPTTCTNDEYEARMRAALTRYREAGISTAVAGDIFLEDVRRYRETLLASAGMEGIFPLWGGDTAELVRAVIAAGFRVVTVCVDSTAVDRAFAGRELDEAFLSELPAQVDPCGENGEYHTFVYDGPIFREPVPFIRGEVVLRDGRFYYCDLLPIR